uniref:hypothetical protein n=1 Tax=uncultured Allobacillus sp. TaxID=1638025 RepID=UPI002597847F|nr:hypothetical protein [uncultured Allobacillus sp.]
MKKWLFIFIAFCVAISIVYIFYFKTTTLKEILPSMYENNIKSMRINEKFIGDEKQEEREVLIEDQEVIEKILKDSSDMKLKDGDFHSEAQTTSSFYFIRVVFDDTSKNFSFYMVDSGLMVKSDSYTVVEANDLKQALNQEDVDWESVK